MATLIFRFVFLSNDSPAVVLTSTELTGAAAPTINISSTAYGDGAIASVVSGGAMTYDSYTKSWSYRLAGADLASYVYVGAATTTYATASPATVHALGIVVPDELVGSRAASATALSNATWTDAKAGYLAGPVALEATLTALKGGSWSAETLKAIYDSVALRLATASYTIPPTVGAIADQVWDEALSGHVTNGTAGKTLSAAGNASDPLLNTVPGSYAAGSAGYALGRIGVGEVTAVVPVASNGDITLIAGDDYLDADGRALQWTDTGLTWPTLSGGTVAFIAASFSKAMTIVDATHVKLELTDSETAALRSKRFAIVFTDSGGHVATLFYASMTVVDAN